MAENIKEALSAKADELKGDDSGFSFEGLWNVIETVLRDGAVTQADFEPVVGFAEQLFDDYVVPFDIPGLGKWAESIVEQRVLRPSIRVGLKVLFDNYVPE